MAYAQTLARQADDLTIIEGDFARSVVEGLSKAKKTLPCRFFYDARGSELFEKITRLPEYYPTRTEAGILSECAGDIVASIGNGDLLVEFGSGSSLKTEILLDRIREPIVYVAIDVAETALREAKARLAERYPSLDIRPIVADFSRPVPFPRDQAKQRKTGFFPGSTIGNLAPADAGRLLAGFGRMLGEGSHLIIGVDLKKDPRTLVRAYDDAAGVTAAFNLNLLERINRELGGTFDTRGFRHEAVYDPREGRIEMHLVSTRDQDIELLGRRFHFRRGESIHTENSYKYTVDEFHALAKASGWRLSAVWTDHLSRFSVHELVWGLR
jgi:dimethylhistidine N-methyltransferase